jgi:trans-aconitate 2-methyltransferase
MRSPFELQGGMAHDPWSPYQYERFRAERQQPFWDLLALVRPEPGMRVVDLGCGTGNLTAVLHRELEARETIGIDSSEAMIARTADQRSPGLRFQRGDIAEFAPAGTVDVVFSNAALHWVPDHEQLFARLTGALCAGGQLAVQMPANHDHPSHVVAAGLAADFGIPPRESPVQRPETYAALLDRLGYSEQHVRLQVYVHHLAARDEVVEWVKGTLLTDYERRLPPEEFAQFLARYRERLLPLLDDSRPYLYPFKRIHLWGRRPR